MARIKKCTDCGSIMECTAWHFGDDAGDVKGTGDFDCRNDSCDNLENNTDHYVIIDGYSTMLEDLPDDKDFEEFLDEQEDYEDLR